MSSFDGFSNDKGAGGENRSPLAEELWPKTPRPFKWGRWLAAAVVGAILASTWYGVRDWYFRKMRVGLQETLHVELLPEDVLIDTQNNSGIDRDEYYSLQLTPQTYEELYQRVRQVPATRPTRFQAEWPWPLPADAEVFEFGQGGGASYAFSPSTRKVYVYIWTM
jgi:hypothetical protein